MNRSVKWSVGLLCVAVAACAACLLRPDWFAGSERNAQTILIAGTDQGGKRTDTLLVAYVSAKQSTIRILAIPRDTDPDGSGHKINSVLGRQGMPGLKESVANLLGHRIDHTVLIKVNRLPAVVDTVFPQGVEIAVPRRMRYEDKAQKLSYDLAPGLHRLTGHDFVCFLRDRSDHHGDLGRMGRQASAMKSIGPQLARSGAWARLPAIVRAVHNAVSTDMSDADMLRVAAVYRRAGGITVTRLPGAAVMLHDVSYFVPDPQATRRCAAFALTGTRPPEGINIAILNGTRVCGLAHRIAERLRSAGIDVTVIADATHSNDRTTTVTYWPSGSRDSSETVASLLPVKPSIIEDRQAGGSPGIVVELGSDATSVVTATSSNTSVTRAPNGRSDDEQ